MGKIYRMRGRMVAVIVFPSKEVDADEWMGIEERRMRELSTFLSTFFRGNSDLHPDRHRWTCHNLKILPNVNLPNDAKNRLVLLIHRMKERKLLKKSFVDTP